MATPNVTALYTPRFHMPVIDSADALAAYANVASATTVQATAVDRYALRVVISNPTYNELFSFAGCVVYFVPPGGADPFRLYEQFSTLPPLTSGSGFLVLGVHPTDVTTLDRRLSKGVPPLISLAYLNVEPTSVRTALKPFVSKLPDRVLRQAWETQVTGTRAQYEQNYLDRVMQTERGVSVPGGTKLGVVSLANPADPTSTTVVFMAFEGITGVSLLWHIHDMPDYGGNKWTGHPLISAVAGLDIPVDINLQIGVWDSSAQAFAPLTAGTAVDLLDFDMTPPQDVVQTSNADSSGNGIVTFNTLAPNATIADRPSYYFRVHLATNPEPGILTIPWSSKDGAFGPYSGYYPDFKGSQIGKPGFVPGQLPSGNQHRFNIGLGFWSDLITFRAPASIVNSLTAAGQSVQYIESAYDPAVDDLLLLLAFGRPVNLDYYPVIIHRLPTTYPSAAELLEYVRVHLTEFVDHSWAEFFPRSVVVWNSADPLGSVVSIDMDLLFSFINPDDGCVVVAETAPTRWRFMTIFDPTTLSNPTGDLEHPLGGVREFGFFARPNGVYEFFTRAADRPWSNGVFGIQPLVFAAQKQLWFSFQEMLTAYVNANGGDASVGPVFEDRFDWPSVNALYGL